MHILSATFVLTSMAYSYFLWRNGCKSGKGSVVCQRIQTQTWLVIIPFAIIQLATGFTMISLQHEDLSQFWIKGSALGFIIAMGSWFAFIYFLLSEQQCSMQGEVFFRRTQATLLLICTLALLSMVFFMANKIV